MILRKASAEDCEQYFIWANDEVVRQNAFNQDTIDWGAHQKWFKSKLDSSSSFLYIAQDGKNKIGQTRFDCKNDKMIVDYSISNNFRGFGLGKKMLKDAINRINKDCSNIKIIEAKIKVNNIASNKIFLGLNFEEQSRMGQVVVYQLQLP
jgi:RimJ/RimL family protein N-acetyltransferase